MGRMMQWRRKSTLTSPSQCQDGLAVVGYPLGALGRVQPLPQEVRHQAAKKHKP